MDRIEDETIRYLYFLRIEQGAPDLPFPTGEEEFEEEDDEQAVDEQRRIAAQTAAHAAAQAAAQASVQDLTRNIQRKKEREMEALQLVGGDGAANGTSTTVIKGDKVGRNDPCPCGSGKKYKKCHGA